MPTFQTVRGMRDLLGDEAEKMNFVMAKARETARLYGYREVLTQHYKGFPIYQLLRFSNQSLMFLQIII